MFDTNEKPIASLFSKGFLNEVAIYKLNNIIQIEQKINRDKIYQQKKNKTYDF